MNLFGLAFLAASFLLVGLAAEKTDSVASCTAEDESCTMVATPAEWPNAIVGETVVAITRHYAMQLPGNPAQVVSSEAPWLLAIRYKEGGRSLAMVSNKREEALFSHLPNALSLADFLRYVYTTRPDDKPGDAVDREAWEASVAARTVLFSKVTSAQVFTRGSVTVYYVERKEPRPSHQSVYVVDSRRPDEFLTIDFNNFQPCETLGIVGSIRPRD